MRKILLLAAVACLFIVGTAFADSVEETETIAAPRQVAGSGESLVNDQVSILKAKVNELERRLNDLDRDRRFDQDRLRQLDRDVSELKRRF